MKKVARIASMFHVTRCPNCRTSFKVTDQHLAAFEGKVRCGRCAFVFDANQHLIGESPAPDPAVRRIVPSQHVVAADAVEAAPAHQHEIQDEGYGAEIISRQLTAAAEHDEPTSLAEQHLRRLAESLNLAAPRPAEQSESIAHDPESMLELDLDLEGAVGDGIEQADPESEAVTEPPFASPAMPSGDSMLDLPDTNFDAPLSASVPEFDENVEPVPLPPAVLNETPITPSLVPDLPAHQDEASATPLFAAELSNANKEAYRPILTAEDEALLKVPSRPSPWRWLWSIPCTLALVALALQVTLHLRTEIAIQLPSAEPALRQLSNKFGYSMPLPARSELLRTEWSELNYVPDHPELIQLNAILRNQANFNQALPLLELTLTDDQERVATRKLFTAKQYLAPLANGKPAPQPSSLGAGEDLRVFLRLDLGQLKTAGYELKWVYPQRL